MTAICAPPAPAKIPRRPISLPAWHRRTVRSARPRESPPARPPDWRPLCRRHPRRRVRLRRIQPCVRPNPRPRDTTPAPPARSSCPAPRSAHRTLASRSRSPQTAPSTPAEFLAHDSSLPPGLSCKSRLNYKSRLSCKCVDNFRVVITSEARDLLFAYYLLLITNCVLLFDELPATSPQLPLHPTSTNPYLRFQCDRKCCTARPISSFEICSLGPSTTSRASLRASSRMSRSRNKLATRKFGMPACFVPKNSRSEERRVGKECRSR